MRILCLLLMLYSSAFGSSMLPTSDHVIEPDRYQKYSLKVVGSNLNTFGYEIYADNKLFIRQLTVPGIPGNKGFRRRRDAEKIAKLVIDKLSKGILPPTIDKKEMDQLHIKY